MTYYNPNPNKYNKYSYPPSLQQVSIHYGKRDQTFFQLIDTILKITVNDKLRTKIWSDPTSIQYFSTAFTHSSANAQQNYEFLEILGDNSLNKCVFWYLSRRFPQLNCPGGSDMLARLKINTIKKESLASIAESLGFWDFISVSTEKRNDFKEKPSLLEDVCEAFFAVVEIVVDKHTRIGVGYSVVYNIFSKLLDRKDIHIKYEEIVDANTRIKELFQIYRHANLLGKYEYQKQRDPTGKFAFYTSVVQTLPDGQRIVIGNGGGSTVKEAEQNASEHALHTLRIKGIERLMPKEYIEFCM